MVRVVAANLTHDHLRAQNAKKRGGDFHQVAYDSSALARIPSPYGHETVERCMQLKEIDARERQTASARDYVIFWLHFYCGMSANSIARMSRFHLTPKGVESSLRRTVDTLKKIVGESS
jgi:RNA polymerase sigma-70 factor (ECF subfamily)